MYAIIETGGKQYKVQEGDIIFIEKLNVEQDATVTFDKVLAVSSGENFSAGAPYVEGATVTANVVKNGKAKKIHVLKYKAKKNEKKKNEKMVSIGRRRKECLNKLSIKERNNKEKTLNCIGLK